MTGRRPISTRSSTAFVLAGLAVALLFAFGVSHFASSEPDGLERVAIDHGFADTATPHGSAASPLADYGVDGVHGWLSTGLAGGIGVLLCFALGAGLVVAIRWTRRRSAAPGSEPRN